MARSSFNRNTGTNIPGVGKLVFLPFGLVEQVVGQITFFEPVKKTADSADPALRLLLPLPKTDQNQVSRGQITRSWIAIFVSRATQPCSPSCPSPAITPVKTSPYQYLGTALGIPAQSANRSSTSRNRTYNNSASLCCPELIFPTFNRISSCVFSTFLNPLDWPK